MGSFRVTRPNKRVVFPRGVQEELLMYLAKNGSTAVYGTHTDINRSLSSIQTAMKRLEEMNLVTFSGTQAGERGQTRRLFSLTLQGFCIALLTIEHQQLNGTITCFTGEEMTAALLIQWGALTPVTAEWSELLFRLDLESLVSGERIQAECMEWFCIAAAIAAQAANETEPGNGAEGTNLFTDAFCSELMLAAKKPRNQEWILVLMTIAAEEMPVFYGVVEVAFTAEIERLLNEAAGLGSFLATGQ